MRTYLALFLVSTLIVLASAKADETTPPKHKTHKTILAPDVSDSVSPPTATDTSFGSEYSSNQGKYGLGFATSSRITANSTALTGIINLTPTSLIQPLFSLGHTSGALEMTFGGIYKYTVIKHGASGIHVGGSLGLGWIANGGANDFGFNLGALAGFHFPLPGTSDAIMLHFDGGAIYSHHGDINNFSIDTISPALGLSVLYML